MATFFALGRTDLWTWKKKKKKRREQKRKSGRTWTQKERGKGRGKQKIASTVFQRSDAFFWRNACSLLRMCVAPPCVCVCVCLCVCEWEMFWRRAQLSQPECIPECSVGQQHDTASFPRHLAVVNVSTDRDRRLWHPRQLPTSQAHTSLLPPFQTWYQIVSSQDQSKKA